MIETCRLKNVVIFFQTISEFFLENLHVFSRVAHELYIFKARQEEKSSLLMLA